MKLIVVACNAATSAALPDLQSELSVPVVGVITPEAHAAVQSTRNRRIGAARHGGDGDRGSLRGAGAHARRRRRGLPGRVSRARAADRERRSRTAPRRSRRCASTRRRSQAAGVDTVILGCTHYPLIRPILQRVFGRGVTLVFSAEETAREVAETLARKGIENDAGARRRVPLPHDRRPGVVPRDGRALPAAADRPGRARHDRRAARRAA